jgi:hypothetical protein
MRGGFRDRTAHVSCASLAHRVCVHAWLRAALIAACGWISTETPAAPLEGQAAKPEAPPVATWHTDYAAAQHAAKAGKKLLLVFFSDPATPESGKFESQVLGDQAVVAKLADYVCVKLPTDIKIADAEGKEVALLHHAAFKEMLGQPGVAVVDYAHQGTPMDGTVVSVFPLTARLGYTPQQMQVALDLPPGTLTQRTLIYAVRIHPEAPASAQGKPDSLLLGEAESHSDYQARIRVQGHHRWESRFPRISAALGCTAREVCAESWPGQGLLEAAVECVRCWRTSHGHWSAVQGSHRAFGYDMKLGANGVWYATGIFGLR